MLEKTAALLKNCKLPNMFAVKQIFNKTYLKKEEIPSEVECILSEHIFSSQIYPGERIAITAGSRGIANIAIITKAIVDFVKKRKGQPFIVPAMGSHGRANAEGQKQVLTDLGITEEFCGCPIRSSMKVKKIGTTADDRDVYIDKNAAEADGIIVCCRIKPHTSFRGPFESGIMKMMAIGLGKQAGAQMCHLDGFNHMDKNIPLFGSAIIKNAPILFSVAILENPYDETYKIEAVNSVDIYTREPQLLKEAFSLMPRIYCPECDVLVVDEVGKNYSGDGMDPNITGTNEPHIFAGIKSQYVVALGISKESHGNGMGLGHAIATTKRTVEKLDFDAMYTNAITCKLAEGSVTPIQLDTDKQAIQFALRLCVDYDRRFPKIVRIPNSAKLEHIMLSEAYYAYAKNNPNLIIESEPAPLRFDEEDFLC